MSNLPKFSRALLHPRYWLLWLGIGFLWLLVQLPYPVIYRLGTALGRLAMRVMKSRARIARRNLELCFPEMSAADREALLAILLANIVVLIPLTLNAFAGTLQAQTRLLVTHRAVIHMHQAPGQMPPRFATGCT